MKNLKKMLNKIKANESGATAIEYALIAAGISLVIIVALGLVGDQLTALFNTIAAGLGS